MRSRLKETEMADRISDLPPPILHQILSQLSQNDAVKTCVLSKSWRYLWFGRPNLVFRKYDFKGTVEIENFIFVLEQTLIRYENQNLSIQELILTMPSFDPVSGPLLEKWIPKVVMRNMKCLETFHLSIYNKGFVLPSVVYLSESLREISLEGCKLSQINCTDHQVFLTHLKKLGLRFVKVEDETLERLLSSCPLIEEVSLNHCEGLKTIKVVNNHNSCCSLKNFKYSGSYPYTRIEIADVSRIETIKIEGCREWFVHHHNNIFTRLKSLHLSQVDVTTKSVDSFSCNFPCLEELELSDYHGAFEELQLSSRSIKRLTIEADDPIKVSIDAPNIFEFEYKGPDSPSHVSFTTTSNKWKSKIVLWTNVDDGEVDISMWLHKLAQVLKVLSRSSETSVHVSVFRSVDDGDYDDCVVLGDPSYKIQAVVKHLELCLGSQLCSDYSVSFEVDGRTIEKWNSS